MTTEARIAQQPRRKLDEAEEVKMEEEESESEGEEEEKRKKEKLI